MREIYQDSRSSPASGPEERKTRPLRECNSPLLQRSCAAWRREGELPPPAAPQTIALFAATAAPDETATLPPPTRRRHCSPPLAAR